MKPHDLIRVLGVGLGLALGFWFYGIGRTMSETVNFNGMAFLSGLLLGVILTILLVLCLLIARTIWHNFKLWTPLSSFVALGVALLIGSLLSEWWILRDERQFSTEVQASLDKPYSRPRAWPNQNCSLVFEPGKGIHATD